MASGSVKTDHCVNKDCQLYLTTACALASHYHLPVIGEAVFSSPMPSGASISFEDEVKMKNIVGGHPQHPPMDWEEIYRVSWHELKKKLDDFHDLLEELAPEIHYAMAEEE